MFEYLKGVFSRSGKFIARGLAGAAATLLDPALYIISRMKGADNDPILTFALEKKDWKLIGMRVGSWLAAGAVEYGTTWLTGLAAVGATAVGGPVVGFLAGAAVFMGGTALAAGAVQAGDILMQEDMKQRYPAEYRKLVESGKIDVSNAKSLESGNRLASLDAGVDAKAYPSKVAQLDADKPIVPVAIKSTAAVADTKKQKLEEVASATPQTDKRAPAVSHVV